MVTIDLPSTEPSLNVTDLATKIKAETQKNNITGTSKRKNKLLASYRLTY